MYIVDKKYGNDGYTVWFRTLEALGKVDYHHLDLNDETRVMHQASLCNVSEELYIEIISLLVKLGEFDKELFEKKNILWNQEFIDSIQDAYRKRSNNCITLEELRVRYGLESNTPESSGGKGDNSGSLHQSKLKDSKQEYIGHREFYSLQFIKCKHHHDRNVRNGYYRLIGTIYNEGEYTNSLEAPADHILEIPNQLKLEQYEELRGMAKKRGVNILSKLKRIINNPGYATGKQSLFLLLEDWIEREQIQGTNH